MKHILCYGDSNTWGYDPASSGAPFPRRHPAHQRWTGIAAASLGAEFTLIEEGLNGRMTVFDDPFCAGRNGAAYLLPCLQSHQPLNAAVLMLGTNDMKSVIGASSLDICAGVEALLQTLLTSQCGPDQTAPKVLLVAPVVAGPFDDLPELAVKFGGGHTKSLELPGRYRALATQLGVAFLNAQEHAIPSPLDGLHLDATAHQSLGLAIAGSLRTLLG